jgi:DNA repair ATPase RecN
MATSQPHPPTDHRHSRLLEEEHSLQLLDGSLRYCTDRDLETLSALRERYRRAARDLTDERSQRRNA